MKISSFLRTGSAFAAGLVLAVSMNTALADPGSTPPSGNVSPNFYAIDIDTSGTFDDSLWVGREGNEDSYYVEANQDSGLTASTNGQRYSVFGYTMNAGAGDSGVKGTVSNDDGAVSGSLGYVDSDDAAWGLYTDDDFSFMEGKVYSDPATNPFYGYDKDVEGGVHINDGDSSSYYGSLFGYDGYIGSLVDRASGSAIWGWNTNTGNSVKAIQGWLDSGNTKGILGYRDSSADEHGVYGYKASATEGESGVQGTITTSAVAGTTTTTGFLGYVGKSNSYGVYTSGIVYGTTLQAADGSGAVYTDNITANSGTLSVTASGGTNFSGPVTAESFGTFDYDYTYETSGGSTSVSKTCDGTDEILIACSGRSTSDNFLGVYQYSSTCYATRSSTSGTLYVYAYCFDPTQ